LFFAPIIILLLAKPSPHDFWIGFPLVVAGESIRLWASGYLKKLSEIVTAGPFALCRNPLYVGSFLISVGYFVMCNRLCIWVAGVALFWLFHAGAVLYEEKLLREKFTEQYKSYCRVVPRFFPRFNRNLAGNGTFSVQQMMLNDEHRSAAGALFMTVLFGLRAYLEF